MHNIILICESLIKISSLFVAFEKVVWYWNKQANNHFLGKIFVSLGLSWVTLLVTFTLDRITPHLAP